MGRNTQQGIYRVKNRDKYIGTKDPRFLSSWEKYVMRRFDMNPNVRKWGAEVIVIPYWSTADEKKRRYMVDIYVEYYDRDGKLQIEIIEIKPHAQTQPPKTKGRKKSAVLQEAYTFQVNQDKWAAAQLYAKKRKWRFRILTENDIFK